MKEVQFAQSILVDGPSVPATRLAYVNQTSPKLQPYIYQKNFQQTRRPFKLHAASTPATLKLLSTPSA